MLLWLTVPASGTSIIGENHKDMVILNKMFRDEICYAVENSKHIVDKQDMTPDGIMKMNAASYSSAEYFVRICANKHLRSVFKDEVKMLPFLANIHTPGTKEYDILLRYHKDQYDFMYKTMEEEFKGSFDLVLKGLPFHYDVELIHLKDTINNQKDRRIDYYQMNTRTLATHYINLKLGRPVVLNSMGGDDVFLPFKHLIKLQQK